MSVCTVGVCGVYERSSESRGKNTLDHRGALMANGFSTKNTHTAAHPHAHPPARDRYVYTINNIYICCVRARELYVCVCARAYAPRSNVRVRVKRRARATVATADRGEQLLAILMAVVVVRCDDRREHAEKLNT